MVTLGSQSVLVIGASRGIGLELVRQYVAAGARVVGSARDAAGLMRLEQAGARSIRLDVTDTASAAGLAWQIDGEAFDVVVYAAGVYGPRHSGMQPPSVADFNQVMHTNVLGAMRVLPALADALALDARVAVISSRMGSLGGRSSATGWLYRASKAALNSVLKDASLLLQDKACCVALHPGWVRTDMGGHDADLDVARSAADLRAVLAQVGRLHNGGFFNHDGQVIPW